jgi:hypothetical protein
MLIIPQIAYLLVCVLFAYMNYIQISVHNERVRHGYNGLMHVVTCLYFLLFVSWEMALIMLCIARLFFDVALNLFRKLPFDYVSPEPKSIVDKVEIFVFDGNGRIPKVAYALIILMLNLKIL